MIHDPIHERGHVSGEATITGEQRDSLLVVASLALAAIDAELLPDSLTKDEANRAIEDLREVVRFVDGNAATHAYWDDAEQGWIQRWGVALE